MIYLLIAVVLTPGGSSTGTQYSTEFHYFTVHFNSLYMMVQLNALVCNKILIQMSQTKILTITPTCFDHQMIETCWSDFKRFSL
jgi:hypothetical protein